MLTENRHFPNDVHEYVINGATYIVGSASVSLDEPKTLKDRIERILVSDFTHLEVSDKNATIAAEMCSTATEEKEVIDLYAVEKESA